MVQKIEIANVGIISVEAPECLATCSDLVTLWGAGLNVAQVVRIYASAIAICMVKKALTPYNFASGDPIAHGGEVLRELYAKGFTRGDVIKLGKVCLDMMQERVPKDEEVKEKVDFTDLNEDGSAPKS